MSKKSSSRLKVTANAFCHNGGRTEAFTSSGPKNKDFGVNIPLPAHRKWIILGNGPIQELSKLLQNKMFVLNLKKIGQRLRPQCADTYK